MRITNIVDQAVMHYDDMLSETRAYDKDITYGRQAEIGNFITKTYMSVPAYREEMSLRHQAMRNHKGEFKQVANTIDREKSMAIKRKIGATKNKEKALANKKEALKEAAIRLDKLTEKSAKSKDGMEKPKRGIHRNTSRDSKGISM